MPKNSFNLLSIVVCFVVFVLGEWAVYHKYVHLSYDDWDLAFFSQAFWSLCHSSQYASIVGINYLGDHSYYFSFLILPVFALVQHPMTLLTLKVGAFAWSGYLLYRIISRDRGELIALLWMVYYFIFPANIFALLYEFNIEAFAPVFLLLMIDFFRREKHGPFLIASLFLGLIKENMLLVVFMFGLIALVQGKKDRVKWALLPMAASASAFFAFVFFVIPFFRQMPHHAFWVRYADIIQQPLPFLSSIAAENISFAVDLFGPLGIPVLLAPQSLLFAAPIFLQHVFSNRLAEHTIYFHYGVTLTPFIFLAASEGMAKLSRFVSLRKYGIIVGFLVFMAAGHLFNFSAMINDCVIRRNDQFSQARWAMIRKIPAEAGVVATFEFLAPLSMRKSLYSFHKIYDDLYQDPAQIKNSELYNAGVFQLPGDVNYALIDMDDHILKKLYERNPEVVSQRLSAFFKDWQVVERQGTVLLLRRKTALGS